MSTRSRRLLVYWCTQVVAWGLYAGLFGFLTWVNGTYTRESGQLLLFTLAIGLGSSHLFRAIILKLRWIDLPIGAFIPRLAFAALVLGGITGLLQAALHDVGFPDVEPVLNGRPARLLEFVLSWALLLFIWSIAYAAYHYFIRSRGEEIRALRLETANRDTQLANLRSQLNPHFMFNALNGIRALIDEDPARAKQAITQLSAILRNAMATVKRRTVPLGEEIDMVKAYLALESMRFEERLRVSFDIDPALEREPVPPMMLQTLVENAVRHGIAKRTEGGEVFISAQRGVNGLVLSVRNTGLFVPGQVEGTGIGLRNTRERLERIYGEQAMLHIHNSDGMVVTELEIPASGERETLPPGTRTQRP